MTNNFLMTAPSFGDPWHPHFPPRGGVVIINISARITSKHHTDHVAQRTKEITQNTLSRNVLCIANITFLRPLTEDRNLDMQTAVFTNGETDWPCPCTYAHAPYQSHNAISRPIFLWASYHFSGASAAHEKFSSHGVFTGGVGYASDSPWMRGVSNSERLLTVIA